MSTGTQLSAGSYGSGAPWQRQRQKFNSLLQTAVQSWGKLRSDSRIELRVRNLDGFSTEQRAETLDASTLKEARVRSKQADKTPRSKVEGSMVSKCANPACSTPFHYLREGKVFRIEVEVTPPLTSEETIELSNGSKMPFLVGTRKPARKLEHFWLCGTCAQTMNLLFDKDNGITVLPKPNTRVMAAAAS